MNRRTIIIWGVVVGLAIIGIVATYIFLGNNGSSDTEGQGGDISNEQPIDLNNSGDSGKLINTPTDPNQGSGDYYYWSIMPSTLKNKIPAPSGPGVGAANLIDHVYSAELGVGLSYEALSIQDSLQLTAELDGRRIYLYPFEKTKEDGQYIEIIDVPSAQRFNEISDIILNVALNESQRQQCTVRKDDTKYSIIAKDTSVQDSTRICGLYAKGNNRFFVKPIEEGTAINKLVFVSAGDKELSFDGSFQGKYWYESVVVE